MAPLLLALVPYGLLPALLVLVGHAAALHFTAFTGGLLLLVLAAQIAVGLARLPLLCLGGIAAAGGAAIPLLVVDLGWPASAAAAAAAPVGLVAGGVLWLLLKHRADRTTAVVTLAAVLPLAALPALTAETNGHAPTLLADFGLAPLAGVVALLVLLAWRVSLSPAATAYDAAKESRLPPAGVGLHEPAWRGTACLLSAALAAAGGAVMTIGPAPVIDIAAGDWAILSLALFAMGRLGGGRFGGTLLAGLPLVLLPQFTLAVAPDFTDLSLPAVIAALLLHLVVRRDGTAVWRRPVPTASATRIATAGAAAR